MLVVNILIATTGVLGPVPVSELCAKLLDENGSVTVMTVIEVPHTFLETMDENERRSFLNSGDWETETAEMKALTYLEERGLRAVEPIVAAMRAIDIEPSITYVEGADPVDAIIRTALDIEADMIVMGRHGKKKGLKKLFMGSVTSSLISHAPCKVLVVP